MFVVSAPLNDPSARSLSGVEACLLLHAFLPLSLLGFLWLFCSRFPQMNLGVIHRQRLTALGLGVRVMLGDHKGTPLQ
ncbi:MAG: hypothetical protein LBV75_03410, partial [Paludibacter sp.]|nr:hypothetical protein [Paludibacter sp.]